jgi:putative nucleotidyltransferase with HDIG domain
VPTANRPLLRHAFRRLRLRNVLLIALLLSGIIPMAISSLVLIPQSQEVLLNAEREKLILQAGELSRNINLQLESLRRRLGQLGQGLALAPGEVAMAERLREPWVGTYIQEFLRANPDVLAVRVLDPAGQQGPLFSRATLASADSAALNNAFAQAMEKGKPAYSFAGRTKRGEPLTALAVPIASPPEPARLVVEALFRFPLPAEMLQRKGRHEVGVYLVDSHRGDKEGDKEATGEGGGEESPGRILWSNGGDDALRQALLQSDALRAFLALNITSTHEEKAETPEETLRLITQVSAIPEAGCGLAMQKPRAEAFNETNQMIFRAGLATLLLVALAFLFALWTARWLGRPIQRLADTTHEIAAGNFAGRVETKGLPFELSDLATDFNRMGGYVEGYVEQLRRAAQLNRELFIGSLRALVAAIDAKDPYTRGHSERVAAVSRTVARYLQLPDEVQHKVWIGALLHDVGKIGIEDTVLRKESMLSPREYEQMKMHTVIGAEIMTSIEQLKEVIPAIRSHHEAWNGRGYPDGLKGEQIPLFARIVAVADTFDAITTNRPYQQAYSLEFAVETITKLAGNRFDAKIVTAFLRAFEAGEVRVTNVVGGTRLERLPEPEVIEARAARA